MVQRSLRKITLSVTGLLALFTLASAQTNSSQFVLENEKFSSTFSNKWTSADSVWTLIFKDKGLSGVAYVDLRPGSINPRSMLDSIAEQLKAKFSSSDSGKKTLGVYAVSWYQIKLDSSALLDSIIQARVGSAISLKGRLVRGYFFETGGVTVSYVALQPLPFIAAPWSDIETAIPTFVLKSVPIVSIRPYAARAAKQGNELWFSGANYLFGTQAIDLRGRLQFNQD